MMDTYENFGRNLWILMKVSHKSSPKAVWGNGPSSIILFFTVTNMFRKKKNYLATNFKIRQGFITNLSKTFFINIWPN